MSRLNATGIDFGNTTSLDSRFDIIPQNRQMFFYQNTTPTGWTKITDHNNKSLRVVSGTGGGTGGSSSFTSIFPTSATYDITQGNFTDINVGGTTLTTQQLPAHTHGGGSAETIRSSAGTSPFRSDNRQPRSYAIRAATRVGQNIRVVINFRQPRQIRQPRTYRQSNRSRNPFRVRQPRNARQRRQARSRNPFTVRIPFTFRVQVRSRRPIPFRVDLGRSRRPIPFRQPRDRRAPLVRWQPRRWRGGGGWGRRRRNFNQAIPWRQRRDWRNPATFRQRRQVRQPRSYRQRRNFRQPRSGRYSQPRRQRRDFRSRNPFTFRVRYSARQRRDVRSQIPFRVVVPQRVSASYRQPRQYRVVQRYPQVNSIRVQQRTLTPGGTMRGANTQGPATSPTGGGQSHNHLLQDDGGYTQTTSPINLRIQYIDIILCEFTG